MKRFFTVLYLQLLTVLAFGQQATVKGKITAAGKPLQYATIAIPALHTGTVTDKEGNYKLAIKSGTWDVTVSMMGYQPQTFTHTFAGTIETLAEIKLTEDLSRLDEVVVTGVSRNTIARKNPVPIAIIGKKEMVSQVNTNLIDAIVRGVPGISAVTTGPNISKPFIRGLGYNRVLTLYDGLRQEGQQWGDEHGIEIDQYGVSRAEVVKGPASLTYGSDALAGVINIIPEVPAGPQGKLKGNFLTDYQSNNGLIGSSLGLSLQHNDWKYALRGTIRTAHNYRNAVDGYVYGTAFRESNLSALAHLDKKWGYSHWGATLYDNLQEIPDGSRDSLTRKFTRQVKEGDEDDIRNRPVVPESELKTYTLNPLHQHIQHYRLYNRSMLKLGGGELTGTLGYQQSIRREYNHPVYTSQAGLYVVLNTLNYDLRYNLPAIAGVETSVGVNGMYQVNKSKDATDFPIPDYNLFDIGGFLFARKTFGKIDISGGIRYDLRTIHWSDFYVGEDKTTGFGYHATDTTGATLQFPAFSKQYTGISGSLGITYNISERILVKGNIARGYRAPNITEIGSNGLDPGAHIVYLGNRSFEPEFSLQQDLGFLAYLPDLDLSVELFNNNIQNYIYQARLYDANGDPVVIVPGNVTYSYQQSKARLFGAEATVNLHPRRWAWFSWNNSIAYTEGRNKNKALIDQHGATAKYLPLIPPMHIRSDLKITVPDWKCFRKAYIRGGVDVYAAQSRFYGVDDTETYTPGYTLLNLGVGATIENKKDKPLFELYVQADNLLDKAYQSGLNRLKYFEYYSASPNGRSGIYNMGRNISMKVIVPF
ncbi:iron complex outermembrane recepter protein [Chitinophaga jiangningensis]|uniref:Iron complex outermembrane recepter protein n=1 Tax=Chitinophaga jiangningensis TaxID=1419482 RepID=A0A1M7E462_9BACT|nr:TonB-dependent receptor [Chitinophaga jiangningensis]SHL86493.1 iron complex outermembrane recepter protein [Chitinophaga jiangningensis]